MARVGGRSCKSALVLRHTLYPSLCGDEDMVAAIIGWAVPDGMHVALLDVCMESRYGWRGEFGQLSDDPEDRDEI